MTSVISSRHVRLLISSCPPTGLSYDYTSPTNARVAMLILTLGGKTERRAVKQAFKVLPVVNT